MLAESDQPQARILALRSLDGLKSLSDDDLEQALSDPAPQVREQAMQLAERRMGTSPTLLEKVFAQADDPNPRVAFQLAFTVGETKDRRAVSILAQIARKHSADPWVRTAVLSSTVETADELFLELVGDTSFASAPQGIEFLAQLAQIIGARRESDSIVQVMEVIAKKSGAGDAARFQRAILTALGRGIKHSGGVLPDPASLPPTAEQLLSVIASRAKRSAADSHATLEERRQAVELLGCLNFETSQSTFSQLLEPSQPEKLQLAVLEALANYSTKRVAVVVIEGWPGYTPAVRTRAIQILLSRDEWMEDYMVAIERGQATVAEIDAAGRTQLLEHRKDAIRQAAMKLFEATPRANIIADYRSALEKSGDRDRGKQVFKRECAQCHRIGDDGHAVGPDLASSASRDPEALLSNILDPNRYVDPAYLQYLIVDSSGRTFTGRINAETATSVTLTRGDGANDTILRTNIEQFASTGTSLMPEGLEKRISREEMADLISFLTDSASTATEIPRLYGGTQPGLIEPE
jgi:putative heme-binding domain-containing protein